MQGLGTSEVSVPKRIAGQAHNVGLLSLPITSAMVNGSIVNDCLVDTGSQLTLLDHTIFQALAPRTELRLTTDLRSASGHQMKVLGKCVLPVKLLV